MSFPSERGGSGQAPAWGSPGPCSGLGVSPGRRLRLPEILCQVTPPTAPFTLNPAKLHMAPCAFSWVPYTVVL